MWRIPGERVPLDLDGPTVEVERLTAWPLQFECLALLGRFMAAEKPEAEYAALGDLFSRFVLEAQPSWDIVDHRGAVPNTARGMMRLPTDLALPMVQLWLETLTAAAEEPEAAQPPTAVDAIVPEGPLNREIKRRLRSVRAAA